MNRTARVLPAVLPVLVLAVAATVGAIVTWGTSARVVALAKSIVHRADVEAPAAPDTSDQTVGPVATGLDSATLVRMPATVSPEPEVVMTEATFTTPIPVPEPDPDPVDYGQLNHDVRNVAATLERFNQKLLRMIAQARAEQIRNEAARQGTGTGEVSTNGLNAGPTAGPTSAVQDEVEEADEAGENGAPSQSGAPAALPVKRETVTPGGTEPTP